MIIRTCVFTDKGRALAKMLEVRLDNFIWEHKTRETNTDEWIGDCFEMKAPIVFIGAAGIAVRKIAPFVSDKLTDSPVIVIDEKGQYVIPILSGHVGGANELAAIIASALNAEPVITTATDVEELFSVDVFAVKNGLKILNREGIGEVSSKLLQEGRITVALLGRIDYKKEDVPDCIEIVSSEDCENIDVLITDGSMMDKQATLILECKPYAMGIGCKKATEAYKLEEYVCSVLRDNGIELDQVFAMASIDLKEKEYALNFIETKYRIPFCVYSAETLQQVEGEFAVSDFVKNITGVDNVCERAAVKQSGEESKIVIHKTAKDGMTVAVAEKKRWEITWET